MFSLNNKSVCLYMLLIFNCLGCKSDDSELNGGYSTCSADATDADGDGWGWESTLQQSCRIDETITTSPKQETQYDQDKAACAYEEAECGPGKRCNIFPEDSTRPAIKSLIWEAMYDLNKKDKGAEEATCRANLAVAMAMQEAHVFKTDKGGDLPYDSSKDRRRDGAQNVSIFNMNIDFIRRSCQTDCDKFRSFSNNYEKMYLNNADFLEEAVMRLNEGFNFYGISETLYFHRGGYSGWKKPGSDERRFEVSLKSVANYLNLTPELRNNGKRVSYSIYQR